MNMDAQNIFVFIVIGLVIFAFTYVNFIWPKINERKERKEKDTKSL